MVKKQETESKMETTSTLHPMRKTPAACALGNTSIVSIDPVRLPLPSPRRHLARAPNPAPAHGPLLPARTKPRPFLRARSPAPSRAPPRPLLVPINREGLQITRAALSPHAPALWIVLKSKSRYAPSPTI